MKSDKFPIKIAGLEYMVDSSVTANLPAIYELKDIQGVSFIRNIAGGCDVPLEMFDTFLPEDCVLIVARKAS